MNLLILDPVLSVLDLVRSMSNHWQNVSWKKISSSKKVFFESGLLRLNCSKAKKILKWKSILKFDETMELVATWYRSFYSNRANIDNITIDQIKIFQKLAFKRGLKWLKNY